MDSHVAGEHGTLLQALPLVDLAVQIAISMALIGLAIYIAPRHRWAAACTGLAGGAFALQAVAPVVVLLFRTWLDPVSIALLTTVIRELAMVVFAGLLVGGISSIARRLPPAGGIDVAKNG